MWVKTVTEEKVTQGESRKVEQSLAGPLGPDDIWTHLNEAGEEQNRKERASGEQVL